MNSQQLSRLLHAIGQLPRLATIVLVVASLAALMAFDLMIDGRLILFMLYLAPVTICTWYVSARLSQVLIAACAIVWLIDGLHNHTALPITLWNTAAQAIFFLLFVALLTNLRDSYRREHAMARCDPLTGVLNRRAFHDILEHEIARMRRIALPMTLAYIDLDNFKAINDLFGHSIGDELLIQITALAHKHLRTTDQIARIGGDEFVIMMPATNEAAADIALTRLKMFLQEAMRIRHWPVTVSIGAVAFYEAPETIDQALSLADHTMYQVKRKGKDDLQIIAWGHQEEAVRS